MREKLDVARDRLMKEIGLEGVIRGKLVRITFSDHAAVCPLDHVNRQFHAPAPDRLLVRNFTYVSTQAAMIYVAFVINDYVCTIVDWRLIRTAQAGFVSDALEQSIIDRRLVSKWGSFITLIARPMPLDQIYRALARGWNTSV